MSDRPEAMRVLYAIAHARAARAAVVSPLEIAELGDLAAIVGPVTDGYRPSLTDEPVRDRGRLEAVVREHESVVEALHAAMTIVPARFGTLVRWPEGVATLLARGGAEYRMSLSRVDGCAEWTVRLSASERGLTRSSSTTTIDAGDSESGPGTAYLQHRHAERKHRLEAANRAPALATSVLESVGPAVREWRPLDPAAGPAQGGDRCVAAGVALVPTSATEKLMTMLETAVINRGDGLLSADVNGPWPPYHFVTVGEAEEQAE